MIETYSSFAHSAVWCLNIIYFVALVPQIFLNFRLKSTKGLSDSMLLMYFAAYSADTYYAYLLDLPFAYKIFVPAGLAAVIVMIAQHLYYGIRAISTQFIGLVLLIAAASFLTGFVGLDHPFLVGKVCGWIATFLFAIYQIPQVIKVYTTKSVQGLSFLFILTLGIGTSLEFFASFILDLPLPSLITGLRGMIIYSFFCWQFWLHWGK